MNIENVLGVYVSTSEITDADNLTEEEENNVSEEIVNGEKKHKRIEVHFKVK